MSHSTLTYLDSGIELEPLLEKIQQGAAGVQYLHEEEFRAFLGALRDKLPRLRGKNEDEKYDENFMPLLLKLLSVKDEEGRTALFYRDVAQIITKCLVRRHYGYEEDILKVLNIKDNHGKTATDIAQYRPLKRFQQRLEKSHYVLTKKPIVRIFINSTSVEQSNSAYRLADVMKKKLRYDVKITKNFTVETFHEQMNAAAARSSPLIVVILSLAKQDSILDVDGVPIRSRTIVDMMRSTVTKDRLKVLVTECCPRRVLSNPDLKGSGQYSPADPDKNFIQISSQSFTQPTQPGFVSDLTEAIENNSNSDDNIVNFDDIFLSRKSYPCLQQSKLPRGLIIERSFEDLFAEEDEAPDALSGYSSEMGSSASPDGYGTEELMNEHDKFPAVNTREDPVRIPMDQKNFQTVQDRLVTFEEYVHVHGDSNYDRTATEAALVGFVALKYWNSANPSDVLKCLACGLTIWDLSDDVAPLDVHHKLSGGQCDFLKNLPTPISDDDMEVDHEKEDENLLQFVTLNTEPDVSSTRNALLKRLGIKPIGDLFSNDNATEAELSYIGLTSMETAEPVMAREKLRISTFFTFPNEQLMDVSKLVKAGWFWTGIGLEMKCCICGIIHVDWSRSVDPLVRHIQLKADCHFLQENVTSEYLERLKLESTEYIKPQRQVMMEKVEDSRIKPLFDNPITTSVKNNINKFDFDACKIHAAIEDRIKHGDPDFTSEKELVEHLLKMKEETANTEDSGATALTETDRELESPQWKHLGDKLENSSRVERKRKLPTIPKNPFAEEDEPPDALPNYNSEMGSSTSPDAYGTDELVDKITGEDEATVTLSDYSSGMGSSTSLDGSGTEELMKVTDSQIKPLYDNPITTSVKSNFNKFDLDEYKLKEIIYAAIEDRKKHGEPNFTSEKELVEHLLKMKEEAANTEGSGATALTETDRELESLQWKQGDKCENSSRVEMKHKLPTNSKKPIDLNFKELPSLLLCSICLSNIKNTLFMPCAHITACSGCAMTQSNCPMCGSKITAKSAIMMYNYDSPSTAENELGANCNKRR